MKHALVVGSGAGGATVAKELQGSFQVTILEAGKEFRPFQFNLSWLEKLKKTGLFFDEREIQLLFPAMQIRKTKDKMVLVNGLGTGGTTTICTGNGLRQDADLKALGINLDREFEELYSEVPITTDHQKRWRPITKQLFEICDQMGLAPRPTPKMGNYKRCIQCGRCVLGCSQGARWDSRQFLQQSISQGARLITNCRVEKVIITKDKVCGVIVKKGWRHQYIAADLIILAAGGFSTPVILQNSGIDCRSNLFVDPVLCVATEWEDCLAQQEVPMPFVVQKEHFIISPYFDYLSFFFNKQWRSPAPNILSLMIKLADVNGGAIDRNSINKQLTQKDQDRLQQGVALCTEILTKLGADKDAIFLGTMNAGHPGGMFPLTEKEAVTFHHSALPENLYIADASLIPKSLGNPPILTIMAIAKRVSNLLKQ